MEIPTQLDADPLSATPAPAGYDDRGIQTSDVCRCHTSLLVAAPAGYEDCGIGKSDVSHTYLLSATPPPAGYDDSGIRTSDVVRLTDLPDILRLNAPPKIKQIVALLSQSPEQSFTVHQIKESCQVDLIADRTLLKTLTKHPDVKFDGMLFSFKKLQWTYSLQDQNELMEVIRRSRVCVSIEKYRHAYPNIMADLLALKAYGHIWLLRNTYTCELIAYPRYDPGVPPITVDDELKNLFWSIELPPDGMLEEDGMKSAKRKTMAQNGDIMSNQPEQKKKKKTKNEDCDQKVLNLS